MISKKQLDHEIDAFSGYCVAATLREYKKLISLVKRARIRCMNPGGRFGEDSCDKCTACKLAKFVRSEE